MSKTLPSGLQEHLDSGATTMVYCWRITRLDAQEFSFTEHDNDLTFDGSTFEAASGFTASSAMSELGFAVDNMSVEGVLNSSSLNEDDLAAGRFDAAEIELFWVNFEDTNERLLLMRGTIGEVSRKKTMFTAELRGLSHKLQQKIGRVYSKYCDVLLGSAECSVNLEDAANKSTGTIASIVNAAQFTTSALTSSVSGFYSLGTISFTSGLNAGLSYAVKVHSYSSSTHTLTLWETPVFTVAVADSFTVYAGCDASFDSCKDKFDNLINFRGFPYIPGSDSITSYATRGGSNQDGSSSFN